MKRDERALITLTGLRNNNYVVLRFLKIYVSGVGDVRTVQVLFC